MKLAYTLIALTALSGCYTTTTPSYANKPGWVSSGKSPEDYGLELPSAEMSRQAQQIYLQPRPDSDTCWRTIRGNKVYMCGR